MIPDAVTEKFIKKTALAWVKTGKNATQFLYVWYRIYEQIKVLRRGIS